MKAHNCCPICLTEIKEIIPNYLIRTIAIDLFDQIKKAQEIEKKKEELDKQFDEIKLQNSQVTIFFFLSLSSSFFL